MQIVHVSDTHLGAKPYHINRLQEHVIEAFDTVIDYVIEARPRVMIIAGDVIDRPRPETHILLHLIRKLKEVTERGVKVILAHGEHDTPGRRDKTLLEVLSEAIDGVYAPRITGSTLEERVAKSMIQIDYTTIGVYQFVKTHVERQREYAKNIMPLYEKAFSRVDGRKVFIAHIGVEGTLIEHATHVNPRDLPSVDYAALGHHHGRWYWKRDGSQGPLMAVYPGSLYPLTIREARSNDKRGPILVDLSGDEPVIQEEYNVEVAKHIVTREITIPTPEYIKVEQRLREVVANSTRGINKDIVLHVPVSIGITVSRAKIESIFIKLSRQMNKI
ncbi:MAG: metallophosphoesterase, partial [Desulfurococcales archaeon]|nr:metallophosphoesterase [Desulfurococcales archaeon]